MTRQERLTDLKRKAIVSAAIEQFQSNGFANTSMDKIAAAAEVSKRTVYNHFASKDALFDEILQQLWQQTKAAEDQRFDAAKGVDAQLRTILQSKLELLSQPSYLKLARVVLAELIQDPTRAQTVIASIAEKEAGLKLWLREAVEAGALKCEDPDMAADLIHGQLKAVAFWPQVTLGIEPPDSTRREQLLDAIITGVVRQYGV